MNFFEFSKVSCVCTIWVAAFLSFVCGSNCAAQETYQRTLRFLQIPGPLQVGKETSWIDGPLDANGLINYYDKANEVLGQLSVHLDDNAVPIIYDAFGSLEQPAEFWLRLGRLPPTESEKFAHWWKWAEANGHANFTPDSSFLVPWNREQSEQTQLVAKWLEKAEEVLDTLTIASKKNLYYSPFVNGVNGQMNCVLLPAVGLLRHAVDALCWRAMLRLSESPTLAWQDLFTAHRLARLMSFGCMIEFKSSLSREVNVLRCQLEVLQKIQSNARLLSYFRKRMGQIPNRASLSAVLTCERMVELDTCQRIYSQELKCSQVLQEEKKKWFHDLLLPLADWNEVRRDLNHLFDRLIEWSTTADLAEQSRQIDNLNDHYSVTCDRIREFKILDIVLGGRRAITGFAKDLIVEHVFAGTNANQLDVNRLQRWFVECQMLEGLRELSLQVLEKKAEDGDWPKLIDDLKSSGAFKSIVHPSMRESFSYEVNATHVIIRVEAETVQFQR